MDSTALSQAGASAGLVSIILLVYRVLLWANHRRIASTCCRRTVEVKIDIEGLSGTTPPVENKNEPTVKDVRSDDDGITTLNPSTSPKGNSNQTICGGTVSGPAGPSQHENQGNLQSQGAPPGVRSDSGADSVAKAENTDGVTVPEHL
jgi:hypothetical protein